jgi:hypothetical protein
VRSNRARRESRGESRERVTEVEPATLCLANACR